MKMAVVLLAIVLPSAVPTCAQQRDATSQTAPSGQESPSSNGRKSAAHVSYIFGYKRLEKKWQPGENHIDFGIVDFDYRRAHWPISLAAELSLSYTSYKPNLSGFKGNFAGTYEFNVGARKVWERWSRAHPFVGGGFSILGGSTTSQIGGTIYIQESNNARPGGWGEAGLYWLVGEHWHTGVRAEYSDGTITLFGQQLNAGGVHVMGLLGRRW